MNLDQVVIINEPGLFASLIRCGDEIRLKFQSDEDELDSVFLPSEKLISDVGIGLYSAADFVSMMLNAPGYSKNEREMMQAFLNGRNPGKK